MELSVALKGQLVMSNELRRTLESYQRQTKASWALLEQDYALSWVLKGMSEVPELFEHLVFKGGTCLRKCYFGDYRFSQDGDFSVQGDYPRGNHLENLLNKSCQIAREAQEKHNIFITYGCERYQEKRPHPQNQEAFTIIVQYPWHREPLTRVMIEVTASETVLMSPVKKPLIHPYESFFEGNLQVYTLEEIIAEKIRALLQFSKKLHERGWGRSRARDYYDIWRILKGYGHQINSQVIPSLVTQKCANKEMVFETHEALFSEQLMENLNKSWEQWVRPLVVTNLPEVSTVVHDLRQELNKIYAIN